jgi:hypothetical protein
MKRATHFTSLAFRIWIATVALAVVLPNVFAQLTVIPADDHDLDRILARIKPFEELANQCSANDCPEMDCATAQQLQVRLRDARIVMRYAAYWLRRASDAQMKHLTSVAGETELATDRAAKVQKILAYQEWVHGIASGLLEVASIGGNLESIVTDPKLLQSKSYTEMANLLDSFYEGMKDAESLDNRLKAARNDRDFPKPIADMMPALGTLTSNDMNDLKSTLSDVKSLMEASHKYGKDWRKVLKEGKGAAAIGQIVGRYLKAYGDSQIAERQRVVDGLLNDILAQDAVQSQSFKDLQRIQVRRNKAEDAYLMLNKLVVISGTDEGQMTRCLLKLSRKCTGLDLNYASQYDAPEEIEVEDFNVITEQDSAKSWGKALLTINTALPTVEGWLKDVPKLSPARQPSLRLAKTSFTPGEEFSASFTVSSCSAPTSWVGIIPGQIPHGQEGANAQNVKSEKLPLKNVTGDAVHFKAPNESGNYDVRMSDSNSGKELASASFEVKSPPSSLTGLWDYYYRDKITGMARFIEDGQGIRWGWVEPQDTSKWLDWDGPAPRSATRQGNIILTTGTVACGYGPDGRKVGEERHDVPRRLIISDDGKKITEQIGKVRCDGKTGRLTLTSEWEAVNPHFLLIKREP